MKNDVRTDFLVGYGTLLLKSSLGDSIGETTAANKEYIPVIVDGYIRTYNLRPDHYEPSQKLGSEGEESAAMNVEKSASHSFNGIAFRTTASDLDILDKRERYYKRHVVIVKSFETNEEIGYASLYVGQERWITRDPSKLMPLWRDIVWGRMGAYQIGKLFGEYFDQTTYLADNRTLVIDVYRKYLDNVVDVELP